MSVFIDYGAINRVLGQETGERFGKLSENFSDLADAPALLCQAFENWQADGTRSISDHMDVLLDAYEMTHGPLEEYAY